MIWTIFLMNVLTVAVAFKKRMILYSLLNAIFLFLITGEAFQMQEDLERSHTVVYLLHFINDAGFSLSLRYVFGISFVTMALALVSKGYKRHSRPEPTQSFLPDSRFYILLFFLLSMLSLILIFGVVGVSGFLHSSRPGFQSGSTIFLVLLSPGLMPLLCKVHYKNRIGLGDIACFLVSFVVTGMMGRTGAIFYLVVLLLAIYYARGWADARITPRLIVSILLFGFAAASTFLAYSAIRGAQAFVADASFSDIMGYIRDHPEKSALSLEYLYRTDVEGMSGIAGEFTQYLNKPESVHHDYGASWILQGMIQGLPGFLKPHVEAISDASTNLNWYPVSIVATSAESFFMSFGWFGILAYPLTLYCISWGFPLKVMQARLGPLQNLLSYELMAWTILFVHGPLAVWIAFCVFYSVAFILFWPMFKRHIKRVEPKGANGDSG